MPELPEVETVKEGLRDLIGVSNRILQVELMRPDLRFEIPNEIVVELVDADILCVERLAKYILIFTSKGVLISHLGMTGTWRVGSREQLGKHDHVLIHLKDKILIYRDPRRFGILDFSTEKNLKTHIRFSHLGPDPVIGDGFDFEYLFFKTRKKTSSIKTLIMNQEVVVGVGNIYASEALFRSFISPLRESNSLSRGECKLFVEEIKAVLNEAITAGGSSISDFKQASGQEGYFQNNFYVYGREGEPCPVCAHPILRAVQQGRSSFYCEKCQN